MNPVREALMNALGLCETILAMREESNDVSTRADQPHAADR